MRKQVLLLGLFALVVAACSSSSGEPDVADRSTSSSSADDSSRSEDEDHAASENLLVGQPADSVAPFTPLVSVGGSLVAYRAVVDDVLHTVVVDVADNLVRWSVAEPVNRITGVPMPPVTYLSDAGTVVVLARDSGAGAAPSQQALRSGSDGTEDLAIQGRDPATGEVMWNVAVEGDPSDFPAVCEGGSAACLSTEFRDGSTELSVHAGEDGALDRRPGGFERVIVGPGDRDGAGLELTIDGLTEPYAVRASADYRRRELWTTDLVALRGTVPAHPDGGWFAIVDGARIPAMWLGPEGEYPTEPGEISFGAVIGLGPDGERTYLLEDAGPCYAISDAQTFALCDYVLVDGGAGGAIGVARSITMFDLDTGVLGDSVALDPPLDEFDPGRRVARLDGRRWLVDTGSSTVIMDLNSRTIAPADPGEHPHGWCTPPQPDEPTTIITEGQGAVPHANGELLQPCSTESGDNLNRAEVVDAIASGTLSTDGLDGSIVTTDDGPVWVSDGLLVTG